MEACEKLKKPKVITACGCFYDLDDPNPFLADVAKVLHPEGVFVSQLMCLRQMLKQNDVGNLAHEHLEYFTLQSLVSLFIRHGLEIYDIEENDVNGGSYRLFARHLPKTAFKTSQVVTRALHAEKRAGLSSGVIESTVKCWWADRQEAKDRVVLFLRRQVAEGKRVFVYGASTKGNVLLQWMGLDHTVIEGAADRDPLKWGKFTVGTGIPISSESEVRRKADIFLVLPYAFLSEFILREAQWLNDGGTFLVPLPTPKLFTRSGEVAL